MKRIIITLLMTLTLLSIAAGAYAAIAPMIPAPVSMNSDAGYTLFSAAGFFGFASLLVYSHRNKRYSA